jgi:hypothetical protein
VTLWDFAMVNGDDLLATVAPVDDQTMQFTWCGHL